MKKYRLGDGRLFEGVVDLITGKVEDPEGLRLLNRVLDKPETTEKLLKLMMKDLKMKPAPRKKIRRGVGSY